MLFLTTNTNGEVTRSSYDDLPELVEAIEMLGEQDGWSGDLTFRVSLVIDELAQNVVDYSYEDGSGDVEVEVTSGDEAVTIEIIDEGRPFDPLDVPPPKTDQPIDERPVGGLGIHLIRKMAKAIGYQRLGNKNLLEVRIDLKAD